MGLELTEEKLAEIIGNATKNAINESRANLATAEANGASQEVIDGIKAGFDAKYAEIETQYTNLRRELLEQRFVPVLDSGLKHVSVPTNPRMLVRKPRDEAELAGQKMNDELYTLSVLMGLNAHQLRETQTFKDYQDYFGKALDTLTSGSGLEWVPVGYSSQIIDPVMITNRVAQLFGTINMPTPSYVCPVALGRPKAYKTVQRVAITENTATLTDNVTFTEVTLGVYESVAKQLTEDALTPILPWLQTAMAGGLGDGIESCILNGDTTGTHQDYDTNALGATAVEKSWIGLRKRALAQSFKTEIATFTAENLVLMKSGMGKYGLDPSRLAWIVGAKAVNALLLLKDADKNLLMTTMDKVGAAATVVTGQIGQLFGAPVIPSAFCREDVAATGVNTAGGPNTKYVMHLVNRDAYFNGDRRSVTLETQPDIVPQTMKVVATCRNDFKHVFADAETDTWLGYNGG